MSEFDRSTFNRVVNRLIARHAYWNTASEHFVKNDAELYAKCQRSAFEVWQIYVEICREFDEVPKDELFPAARGNR